MDEHTNECVLVYMTVMHVCMLCTVNMYMYTHEDGGDCLFIDVEMRHSI